MKKLIREVNFNDLTEWKNKKATPAVVAFADTVYQITKWEEFLKLFYYFAYKNPKIKELVDQRNFPEISNGFWRFRQDGIKFSTNQYVYCYKNKEKIGLLDRAVYYVDNLKLVSTILSNVKFPHFKLYLYEDEADAKLIESECTALIKMLTAKDRAHKRVKKSARYVIGRINNEILSPLEKLSKRMEKEFGKKVLLGDISITEDEESVLKEYMVRELRALDRKNECNPDYPRVFAFGLVRFAMKWYSQRTFWPYFQEEYGENIKVNNQGELHDAFRRIMWRNGKVYDDDCAQKIDNISMHSFVTDRCAEQLFDYLFDFWRKDLNRNVENMYGEHGKGNFDVLLEEIKASVQDVMKHTSMALLHNEKSCRLRFRRILGLMDSCFWDQKEIPNTCNRINRLLKAWVENPKSAFNKEKKQIIREKGTRGASFLSSPRLGVRYQDNTFIIMLPRQIIRNYVEGDTTYWRIETATGEILREYPELLYGRAGVYTQECIMNLPTENLFDRLVLKLESNEQTYARFVIKESEYRFFNYKGEEENYANKYLPAENLVCYSKSNEFPKILYGESVTVNRTGDVYVAWYALGKGDILLFPDQRAIQAGERIIDGLNGETAIFGAYIQQAERKLPIYKKLPKILFQSTREQLSGTGLFVKNGVEGEKRYRICDHQYYEFKLDDSLKDVYAYLVDLNDFIKQEDCYNVRVDIPHGKTSYNYSFCYLKDIDFEFEGAPYIFKDMAVLNMAKTMPICLDNDWEQGDSYNRLVFNYDSNSQEFSHKVEDRELVLSYKLGLEELKLKIEIPALFWKYKKDGEWNCKQPSNILLKRIPSNFFVCGPFNFKNNNTYISLQEDGLLTAEETTIFAEKVKDEQYYSFPTSRLKSWLSHDQDYCAVRFVIDGQEKELFGVICRSRILHHSLSGDFDKNILYGNFEIEGEEEYQIEIIKDGDLIGQDIPLKNGKFQLSIPVSEGEYIISVYELEEDDSGFDSTSFKIGEFTLDLVDVFNLKGNIIKITGIQDCAKKYCPLELREEYELRDIQKIGGYEEFEEIEIEIVGLWRDDVDLGNSLFYQACVYAKKGKEIQKEFDVLIVLYDKTDVNKMLFYRLYDGEYSELLYNANTRKLIADDSGMDRFVKIRQVRVLEDDKYNVYAEIVREKRKH